MPSISGRPPPRPIPTPWRGARRGRRARRRWSALCAPYLGVAEAPQRVLAERMDKHLGELFVFVEEPDVPATNNAAERSLRHLVTGRKISGGTRSAAGTATKMTLASLFGTWRAQGLDPLAEVPRPPRRSSSLNSYPTSTHAPHCDLALNPSSRGSPYRGTIGSTSRDGCSRSWKIVCIAGSISASAPSS